MYYTGINPETMEPVYVASTPIEKKEQNQMFFFYKKECQQSIRQALHNHHLEGYISQLGLSNAKATTIKSKKSPYNR
jgi:hypothetical protein